MKALLVLLSMLAVQTTFAYEIPIKDSICYQSAIQSFENWFAEKGIPYKAVLPEKSMVYKFQSEDKNYPELELVGINVVLKPYYTEKVLYTDIKNYSPKSFYVAQLKASNDGVCTLMQVTQEENN